MAVSTLDNAADNAQVYTLADVDALIFAKNECTRLGLPDQKERVDEIIMRKYGCQDLAALRATLALESIGKLSSLMKHASCCRDNAIERKSQFGISSRHFQNAVELLSRAESDLTGWVRGAVPKDARCWGSAGSKKFVFASGPEYDNHQAPVLAFAVAVCEGLGFHSVAGDAADQFHMAVMTAEEMQVATKGWRIAWKGKVCTGIELTAKHSKGDAIALVTIDGGPECQWEVNELKSKIIPSFSHVKLELMEFHTWRDFACFFMSLPENEFAKANALPDAPELGRRVYIRRSTELKKYGFTDGCPGCTAARDSRGAKAHSEACRERIVKAMEADAEGQKRLGLLDRAGAVTAATGSRGGTPTGRTAPAARKAC